MLGEPGDRLVEAVAVPGAQIDLVVAVIEAEPAHPMLARWNLFLVVVTGICDRNLLCHFPAPLPLKPIYPHGDHFAQRHPGQMLWPKRLGIRPPRCAGDLWRRLRLLAVLRAQGMGDLKSMLPGMAFPLP